MIKTLFALSFSIMAQAQVNPNMAFDSKKVLAMNAVPEGTVQLKRDDKIVYKGPIKNLKGLRPGDRVSLSKGLHLIPAGGFTLSGETERDDERPVYFEGQGPETIIVEADFFKEKRDPKTLRLLAGGDTSNSFSKMTFVNTEWPKNGDGKRYFTGVRFDDVRFERGYEHPGANSSGQRAVVACYFCIFDKNYPVLSNTTYVDIGSMVFDPEKGYVLRKRLYSGHADLEDFIDALATARRKGGDFSKVSDKEAKALYLSLGETRPEQFQKVFEKISEAASAGPYGLKNMSTELGEYTRNYLTRNYKFTVPPNPAVTKAVAYAEAMLKAGLPLSAFMSLQQLPTDMEPSMVQRVNALRDSCYQQFTKNYQSCYLFASTIGEENSLNWWDRGSKLTDKMHLLMKQRMAKMYPILMMGNPKVCKMEFRFSKNFIEKRTDVADRYIVQDQVADYGAMQAAAEARAAAQLQAVQSIATMTRNLGNNIESGARKDIDRQTHFESHVGGKDLVSWKMDRSTKNSVMDGVAFGGPNVPAGTIMKSIDRVMIRTKTITATELQAVVFIQTGGKTNSFPLEHWKAQYLSADCKSKYELGFYQDGKGDLVTGDRSGTGCVELNYTTDDLTAYAERAMYPVVDGYAKDVVIPTYAKAAQRAGKSNKAEDRVEAGIMSLLFNAEVSDEVLAEIEATTGLKNPKTAVVDVATKNFERMWTEANASRALNPHDPLWKPEAACGGPATLGKTIEQGTDKHGRYTGACYALWWDTEVPYVPAASGSTQFACKRKPNLNDLLTEATVTVDFDLGGIAVTTTGKVRPEKNPPRTVKEWNDEFAQLLTVPFGQDTKGDQFAYAATRYGLVQLELENAKGKSRVKSASCTVCDPRIPMFKSGSRDAKTESYLQACLRLMKMPDAVRSN